MISGVAMIKLVDDMLKNVKVDPTKVDPKVKEIMSHMVADPIATVSKLLGIPLSKLQDKEAIERIGECVKGPPPAPQCECRCEQQGLKPAEFISKWLGVSEKLATKLAMWLEGLTKEELEALLKKVGYG